MKWVTSTDLKHWADTRKSQELLPELIIRLIRATSKDVNSIKFPCGDAIYLSGWDGELDSKERIYNVDSGISLWECGVNSNPKDKADKDYAKRVNNSLCYEKKESTFVFVTPRIWNGAEEWVNDKKQNNEWKNIVVITATELEDWLSLCPAVALWLVSKISGRTLNKVYDLESYWNKWASGKNIKLRPDLLLGGRESEQHEFYECISNSSIAIIQSMALSESLAFAVACILESPDKDNLLSKAIVIEDEDTLELLIDKYTGHVFISNVGHKDYTYATQNGHCIVYAASAAETFNKTSNAKYIRLQLLDREKFVESLIISGVDKNQAELLSRETARNITILRRTLGIDYTCPEWTKPENIREIIPAILVARWSEALEGDKEIISLIAAEPYDSYVLKLNKWLHKDDSPVVKIDNKWRLYSPYEAFEYAAKYITTTDFLNYKNAINRISSDNDPDAVEKMNATDLQFWEHKQKYSTWIKKGLFQTAIMISLSENKFNLDTPSVPSIWVDSIILSILNSSSIEWWFSNKYILELIAEASPRSFIKFIQEDLIKEDSIVKKLFTPSGVYNFWNAQENYTHILFSLQAIVWDDKWLLPVSYILADLCNIENNTNLYNKPINALYETYAIWNPQTYANTHQRMQALVTIAKKYPLPAFELCFKLLNELEHSVVYSTNPMRWRCYNFSRTKITHKEIRDSVAQLCNLMISICENSEEQICKILDLANQLVLGSDNRELLFEYVVAHKDNFIGNSAITDTLRHSIYRHTTYAGAIWALSKDEIDRWSSLLSMLEPENLLERFKWIFKDSHVDIVEIDKQHLDWKEASDRIHNYKYNAIAEIEQVYGLKGVCQFVKVVGCPHEVGESYAYKAEIATYQSVLDLLLNEREASVVDFAQGFFRHYTAINGIDSIISILNAIDIEKYKDIMYIPLSITPCACREMWNFIETLPRSIQNGYWTNIIVGFRYDEDASFLVNKLIEYNRYCVALGVLSRSCKKISISTTLMEKTIIGVLTSKDYNLIQKHNSELADVVYALDKKDDVNIQMLYSIELLVYKVLEQYGNINETKLVKELMSNPESLMEFIEKAYLPSDDIKQKNNKAYAELCFYVLSNLRNTPFVDDKNNINEIALNNYIKQLQILGKARHITEVVNIVIGELLGNYAETEEYPPVQICDIIENINCKYINDGFKTRILNKRGVTIRSAFDGGIMEFDEVAKYKKYADKVRFTHPVVCEIFDEISNYYYRVAKTEDTSAQINKMEF